MKKSQIIFICIIISFALSGIADGYFWAAKGIQEASYVIHLFTFAVLCYFWCYYHAIENGHEGRNSLAFWCFFIAPVGIPLYSYKIYGFKRGSVIILGSVVVLGVSIGAYVLLAETVAEMYS